MKRTFYKAVIWLLAASVFLLGPVATRASGTDNSDSRSIVLTIGGWIPGNALPPRLLNGRTFVTVDFASQLGATVTQDRGKQQGLVTSGEMEILFTAGEPSVRFNAEVQDLDPAPFWEEECLWAPLRFLAETLGWKVSWVQGSREIVLRKGYFSGPTVAFLMGGDLLIRDLKSGAVKALGPAEYNFCWSQDGESIAYFQITSTFSSEHPDFPNYKAALHVVNLSTRSDQVIYYQNMPAFGGLKPLSLDPLKQFILYDTPASDMDGTLYRISLVDRSMVRLARAVQGSFSPMGQYIAFLYEAVRICDRNGGAIAHLSGSSYCWHPNGEWIATQAGKEVRLFDVRQPLEPIASFPLDAAPVAWSDDGEWLACWGRTGSTTREVYHGISALSVADGRVVPILPDLDAKPIGFLPGTHMLVLVHQYYVVSGARELTLNDVFAVDPDQPGKVQLLLSNVEEVAIRPN